MRKLEILRLKMMTIMASLITGPLTGSLTAKHPFSYVAAEVLLIPIPLPNTGMLQKLSNLNLDGKFSLMVTPVIKASSTSGMSIPPAPSPKGQVGKQLTKL